MTFVKKARWAMMLGALALTLPIAGCPKKDDSSDKKDDDKKTDKKKSKDDDKESDGKKSKDDDKKKSKDGDDDDDKGGGDGKAYARGDVLKHMPKKCEMATIFIDVGGIAKEPAIKKNVGSLDDKLVQAMKGKDGEKAEEVLDILKKAKIDPGADIREIAMCMKGEKNFIIGIGGDFAGKDVLGTISKIGEKNGETMKKKDADGVSYIQGKDKVLLGMVTPNVFVATEDADDFGTLAKSNDVSSSWDVKEGRLVAIHGASKKDGVDSVTVELNEKSDAVELKIVAELSGKAAAQIKGDSDKIEAKAKEGLDQLAGQLKKGPLAAIADDLKATTLEIDGSKVTVTAKVSNKHLSDLIQTLVDAKESDLENIIPH